MDEYPFNTKTNQYKIVEILGSGSYGIVFKVVSENKQEFVMKVFLNIFTKLNYPRGKASVGDFEIEREFNRMLRVSEDECHPNIVCVYETGITGWMNIKSYIEEDFQKVLERHMVKSDLLPIRTKFHFLIQELMDDDLEDLEVYPFELKDMVIQTLKGLKWIHSKGFAHNDIKDSNIMVKYKDADPPIGFYKIGDLGSACSPTNDVLAMKCDGRGTILFTSPAILQHFWEPLTLEMAMKGDLWSLGITFYVILKISETGEKGSLEKFPYNVNKFEGTQASLEKNEKPLIMKQEDIKLAEFTFTGEIDPVIIRKINKVINGLLRVNDNERLTTEEALNIMEW